MNLISEHFNKEKLHHAYLIEGDRNKIVPEIFIFLESLKFETKNNSDFYHIEEDIFKIDNARSLKVLNGEMSTNNGKKIFIISINNILLEAQNTLLKIFEEPNENTLFFVVMPNTDNLLKTLISRFYLIKTKNEIDLNEAEKFIKMTLSNRMLFIKDLISNDDEEDVRKDSTRTKALKFINTLEIVLHNKIYDRAPKALAVSCLEHLLKVREYLNAPGSSVKTLLEGVALACPVI